MGHIASAQKPNHVWPKKALFASMLYLVKKKENRDNYSFECP